MEVNNFTDLVQVYGRTSKGLRYIDRRLEDASVKQFERVFLMSLRKVLEDSNNRKKVGSYD